MVRSDAQHKLPPYLRHAPDRIESLERVLDDETIDEVLSLPQLAHVAAAFGAQIATGPASTPDAAAAVATAAGAGGAESPSVAAGGALITRERVIAAVLHRSVHGKGDSPLRIA